MNTLATELRRQLERTVVEARDIAEAGARGALETLAVHHHEPYGHMSGEQRKLRNRLRAHARHLGDRVDARSGAHAIDHLVHECAYEHWHGKLFARFLAENHLLIEPEMGVAITLDECEELAREEGIDKWALAARFAHRMLPQVFQPDHPVFEVQFAREYRLKLDGLVEALSAEVFTATDSLGWVYQFWQTKKKDEVNRSEVKIGADELPAVTQLFTEPYMVQFLLHNSLGACWVGRQVFGDGFQVLGEDEVSGVRYRVSGDEALEVIEDRLRDRYSPPGCRLDYFRFIEVTGNGSQVSGKEAVSGDGSQATGGKSVSFRCQTPDIEHLEPAAGRFGGWPDDLAEFRLLDPCCGSGHFLVAAFLMLVPMRMALEGLDASEAVGAVLRENIHVLELDQRCVAIAAFALALEAWRYPDARGFRTLPRLNLAWCGQRVGGKKEQWLALAEGDPRLEAGMEGLYDTFRDAPTLGSLIDPARSVSEDMLTAGFEELQPLLERALRDHAGEEEWEETAIAALGLAEATRLLSGHYHLVITNVPYLTRGKQSDRLRKFAETRYPNAKNDLANVFPERCLEFCEVTGVGCQVSGKAGYNQSPDTSHPSPAAGVTQIVMRQNWLFLTSYKAQREHLLRDARWELLARLGPGAFETISGEVVNVILLTLTRTHSHAEHRLHGIDATVPRTARGKAEVLRDKELLVGTQLRQLGNPDARIGFEVLEGELLEGTATASQGIPTSDSPLFVRFFWEMPIRDQDWEFHQSTVDQSMLWGGCERLIWYENGSGRMRALSAAQDRDRGRDRQGAHAWGRSGVAVGLMRSLPASLYCGTKFDNNVSAVVPSDQSNITALWCFCSSVEFGELVRQIDQKLNVTNATLGKVAFDLDYWQKVAAERYPNDLPNPWSNDPSQWLFHGHPSGSVVWDQESKWIAYGSLRMDATVLQVAVARLLGYHWPAENDPEMELADEQRAWVGSASELSNPRPYTRHLAPLVDEDGIVCLPSVRGERPGHERLLEVLQTAYGDYWHDGILAKVLAESGSASVDDWLCNQFFDEHCRLFQHRPFIWHIWDGRKRDGFHALVNYHRLTEGGGNAMVSRSRPQSGTVNYHRLAEGGGNGRRLLESLTYSYLGDWIGRQQDGVKRGEGGAEDCLAAALELQKRLVAILEGEPPFDLFVRWKPIDKQPIGWEPEINNGVRLNIRPFMAQDLPGGKKGAGILRAKPNIHWKKDRGKEPTRDQAQFPWFWRTGKFTGERVNDVHLTNAEKRAAREWMHDKVNGARR